VDLDRTEEVFMTRPPGSGPFPGTGVRGRVCAFAAYAACLLVFAVPAGATVPPPGDVYAGQVLHYSLTLSDFSNVVDSRATTCPMPGGSLMALYDFDAIWTDGISPPPRPHAEIAGDLVAPFGTFDFQVPIIPNGVHPGFVFFVDATVTASCGGFVPYSANFHSGPYTLAQAPASSPASGPAPTPASTPPPTPTATPSPTTPATPQATVPCAGLSGKPLAKCKLDREVERKCGSIKKRSTRDLCAKRVRAIANCRRIEGNSRRARQKRATCLSKAKRIGK
jgi:hypothetical protein